MDNVKVKPTAFIVQFLSSIAVAYLTTLIGFVFSWPSYTIAVLKNDTMTPLEAPMTSTQIDLLGSLVNVGALLATPFCGTAISRLGRKYSAMLFGLPFVLAWTIISVTKSINLVLFSMFLAGFGAAGQVVSSVYISEIVQDSIRGGLTTTVVYGYFGGVVISYTLGWNLEYKEVIYMHLALSILYLIMLAFLKESPVYLVQNGRDVDAAKSIAFYRRISYESKEVEIEIKKIKRLLDPRIEEILQNQETKEVDEELLGESDKSDIPIPDKVSAWTFLLKSPSSKRALVSCLLLMIFSIMSGALVLQVYAEPVLKEAVPSISEKVFAMFLALVFMIAALLSGVLTDKFGRRPITTWSSIATGLCTLLIGLQLHLNFAPPWFTVFIFFAYAMAFNLGMATTPFVLTAEAFLPEVKGLCNSFSMGCMWLVNFVLLYTFYPIVLAIGLGPTFYVFASVCFIASCYSHFCLPETKGLPADKIQLLFYKRNKKTVEN